MRHGGARSLAWDIFLALALAVELTLVLLFVPTFHIEFLYARF